MWSQALVCLLLAGTAVCNSGVKSYKRYRVLSTTATTQEQLAILQSLSDTFESLDFLQEPSTLGETTVVVPPELKAEVTETLRNAGMTVTVQATDLQAQIDAEKRSNQLHSGRFRRALRSTGPPLPLHDKYYTLQQINEFMNSFQELYPTLARKKALKWKTHENRTVYYMEIGTRRVAKPVILIEALAHCREWIASAAVLYTMHSMLWQYKNGNTEVQNVMNEFTWIFIPVVNPDGYEYTWTTDRLWRNNRHYFNESCTGVNLNRNFDVKFGTTGVSSECGSINYPGEYPFSEPETRNIRDLFRQLSHTIAGYVSVHSYSQVLIYPWGYENTANSPNPPSNVDKLIKVGEKMKTALKYYRFGTAYQVLRYGASGASEDWALQEKPGIYSYCYELRPRSRWSGGFTLRPREIIPTGVEFKNSLVLMALNMAKEGYPQPSWMWVG